MQVDPLNDLLVMAEQEVHCVAKAPVQYPQV